MDAGLRRAEEWLLGWDASGVHRTGTAGDAAGADWLAGEVARLGLAVTREDFSLSRITPEVAVLEVAGERFVGEPMFDAPDTGVAGVSGILSWGPGLDVAATGVIHVLELSPRAVYAPEFARFRRETRAEALVIVTRGQAPGLALLNAEAFRAPYGPPVLQLASEAGGRLAELARAAAMGRVVLRARREAARAENVVARVAGQGLGQGVGRLVVMTPRSSWWQSTAERGGGIVCWLEAMRAVLAASPGREVVFTANSGHELGHIGLDDFLARRPGWDRPDGARWVHFGANIGAAGGALQVQSNWLEARGLFAAGLAGRDVTVAGPDVVPSGETRDIHLAGGAYVTLVGENKLFHLPQDRWPDAVDVPGIAAIAAVAAGNVLRLAAA